MSKYDTAQICLSGHVNTHRVNERPNKFKKFCLTCGEPTITKCEKCDSPIQGMEEGSGIHFYNVSNYIRPNYCHECGNPYPWTQNAIFESLGLIDKDTNLSGVEKDEFKQTVTNVIKGKESPSRFKTFIKSVSFGTAESLKDILVNILSEAINKSIWP